MHNGRYGHAKKEERRRLHQDAEENADPVLYLRWDGLPPRRLLPGSVYPSTCLPNSAIGGIIASFPGAVRGSSGGGRSKGDAELVSGQDAPVSRLRLGFCMDGGRADLLRREEPAQSAE